MKKIALRAIALVLGSAVFAKMLKRILIFFVVLLFGATAFAQMKVYVTHSGDDSAGTRLGYAIKEGIRRSAGMTLVNREQDGRIAIRIVTLDPDDRDSSGRRTIYSAVLTAETLHNTPVTMFLTTFVGICGVNRIQACADGLVAETDKQVSWIQSLLSK